MPKSSHNNTRQAPEYYTEILRILIATNAEAKTYAQIADALNTKGLKTPTGLKWEQEHIRQTLKKLRNYSIYPSFLHQHMLELIFEQKLTLREVFPLYKSRLHGVK